MKKISSIALWAGLAISLIVIILFFTGGEEAATLSTGAETTAPVNLDMLLYWTYIIVAIGVIALILFACKTFATMFQTDSKAAIKSLASVVVFFLLMIICYVASPATEFSRVVNGEVEAYSASDMKMIDMWLFSNYILIGATIVLIIAFAAKRLINK